MIPIYNSDPSDWRDLQKKVAKIYSDLGYETTIEKDIQTARGIVNVDVFSTKNVSYLTDTTIVECKHWNKPVPKTVVHAFRSVISDYGANNGYIISQNGFQSGAFLSRSPSEGSGGNLDGLTSEIRKSPRSGDGLGQHAQFRTGNTSHSDVEPFVRTRLELVA